MDLMEAIRGRRSIRKYRPDPVPEEALQTLMEAARWAPSWGNTQCWKFILVKDSALKSELAKTVPKTNPARSTITEAPVLAVLCGAREVSGYAGGRPSTAKGDWLMFDTGLAMENLCLAAYALGLGTVIIGMFDHQKVAEVLGVPRDVEVVAMTPLGYPAAQRSEPKRKEVSEFVFHERYQKRDE